MWTQKTFKSKEDMEKWLEANKDKIQFIEIYCNNAYAIEYKKLRFIM